MDCDLESRAKFGVLACNDCHTRGRLFENRGAVIKSNCWKDTQTPVRERDDPRCASRSLQPQRRRISYSVQLPKRIHQLSYFLRIWVVRDATSRRFKTTDC